MDGRVRFLHDEDSLSLSLQHYVVYQRYTCNKKQDSHCPHIFFFLYLIPRFGKQELDPQRFPRNSHILPLVSFTNAFLDFGLVDLELTLQPSLITPEP